MFESRIDDSDREKELSPTSVEWWAKATLGTSLIVASAGYFLDSYMRYRREIEISAAGRFEAMSSMSLQADSSTDYNLRLLAESWARETTSIQRLKHEADMMRGFQQLYESDPWIFEHSNRLEIRWQELIDDSVVASQREELATLVGPRLTEFNYRFLKRELSIVSSDVTPGDICRCIIALGRARQAEAEGAWNDVGIFERDLASSGALVSKRLANSRIPNHHFISKARSALSDASDEIKADLSVSLLRIELTVADLEFSNTSVLTPKLWPAHRLLPNTLHCTFPALAGSVLLKILLEERRGEYLTPAQAFDRLIKD